MVQQNLFQFCIYINLQISILRERNYCNYYKLSTIYSYFSNYIYFWYNYKYNYYYWYYSSNNNKNRTSSHHFTYELLLYCIYSSPTNFLCISKAFLQDSILVMQKSKTILLMSIMQQFLRQTLSLLVDGRIVNLT